MPRFLYNLDQSEFRKAEDYLNKISVVDSTKKRLTARVQGSAPNPYQVTLQKSDLNEEVYGMCSCPSYFKNGQCKHIAAVILKESGNFFEQWNGDYEYVNHIGITPKSKELEYEYDEEEESSWNNNDKFDELFEDYIYEQKEIKNDLELPELFYKDTKSHLSRPEVIWYFIDFYTDTKGVNVDFSLQCQSKLSSGRLGKIKNIKVDPEIISLVPGTKDKEILNALCAFGRWEYSHAKNNSTFTKGSYNLKEQRELFKKMVSTGRVIKRTYRYYDVDEDKYLVLKKENAKLRFHVDSSNREVKAKVHLENTKVSLNQDNEIFDQFFIHYDEVHEIDQKDKFTPSVLKLISEVDKLDSQITNEQWNKLQNALIKNIPHHMFIGDKFNLEIETLDIYFELYLKWEDDSDYIRGLIYVPDRENNTKLIELNYKKLEDFLTRFKDFNFTDNKFLFKADSLYDLSNYASENLIPLFFKDKKVTAAKKFDIDVTSGINWLDLHPKLDFLGISKTMNFREIIKKVDLQSNTIKLSDDKVGIIPPEWIKKIKLIKEHALITKDTISLHPAKSLVLEEFPEIKLQKNIKLLKMKLENFKKIDPIAEDSTFNGELRSYQRLALGWFDFLEACRFGGCLADDMGLGKTVQIIAHLQKRLTPNPKQKVLIICPKSLTGNWESEFSKFAPEITHYNWKNKTLTKSNFEKHQVIFVSYQLLQRQKEFDFKFDYLILDEAQMIKNSNSLTHKAVAEIKARHKIALTGTPVENHVGDLMSIFNIIIPGLFESKKIKDPHALRDFKFLRPFILRRTKEEVLTDLPEKTIQTIYCDQSKEEKKEYLSFHIAMKKELENKEEEKFSKLMFLQVLTKLRQAANHIKLVDNGSLLSSAKLETLKELVSEIHESGNKVIIFSQFTKLLKIVKEELNLDETNSTYLDGSTRNRDDVINKFKSIDEVQTFLISIKAGGVGLNLTNASYCIILDPWWNPAVESQAIDRIHRIGQKKPVFAYRLITRDTIEEKVHELQNSKRELYNTVLESNEGFIRELKQTDIQFLLS